MANVRVPVPLTVGKIELLNVTLPEGDPCPAFNVLIVVAPWRRIPPPAVNPTDPREVVAPILLGKKSLPAVPALIVRARGWPLPKLSESKVEAPKKSMSAPAATPDAVFKVMDVPELGDKVTAPKRLRVFPVVRMSLARLMGVVALAPNWIP